MPLPPLCKMEKLSLLSPEERLNRVKHYAGFPALAVKACLDAVGAKITDVDHVAVGQDSDANLAKKVRYALANPAKVLNFIRLRQRKEVLRELRPLLSKALEIDPKKLRFHEHHLEHHIAHIASAYYCSPWENAAGFSYDGSGDFVSTMMARCEGNDIEVLDRVFLPHSLGSFYTMICEFVGYKKYGDEGKVMGLAPYGKDTYLENIRETVDLVSGGFQLNLDYFMPLGSNQGMQIQADGTVRMQRHFPIAWRSCSASHVNRNRNYAARHGSRLRHAASLRRGLLSSAHGIAPTGSAARLGHGRGLCAE